MLTNTFVDLLNFKHKSCIFNNSIEEEIPYKYINLYVKIADKCNARCKFCEYHDKDVNFIFYFDKFTHIIKTLEQEDIHIHKVSFTGGEPTLNLYDLRKCLEFLKSLKFPPFTVVNSNGLSLKPLIDDENLDNISLSRHTVSDKEQFELSGTKSIPRAIELMEYGDVAKVHLTCNLIKGYVDSSEKIIEYLEFAASLGIYDVGFVSLMQINKFCEQHHIDFDDIIFKDQRIVCNKEWSYKDVCKCKNFLYLPEKGNKVIKFYSRYRCKNEVESGSNYIFDGKYLRSNFGGSILY